LFLKLFYLKNYLVPFFLVLLLFGCETDSKLTFEPIVYENTTCENCAAINISVPKASGKLRVVETINNAINETLIYNLKYEDSLDVDSVETAMESFSQDFKNFKLEFKDETITWEAEITGVVSYQNNDLATILLNTYIFTGGAHGYEANLFLNFDLAKSIELENYQLFKDIKEFEQLAENRFRAQNKIPKKGPINQTGFMFSDDTFHLPENIGFTEEGIQLIYNQYEVASYADGTIEVLILYEEAQPFLNYSFTE